MKYSQAVPLPDAATPSWHQAAATLYAFYTAADPDASHFVISTAAKAQPTIIDAAQTLLVDMYLRPQASTYDPKSDGPIQGWTALCIPLLDADDNAIRYFVDKILFSVQSSALYAALAQVIHGIVGVRLFVEEWINTLRVGSEKQRINALRSIHYLFGRPTDPRLGGLLRRRMNDAAETLRKQTRVATSPTVASALREFHIPQDLGAMTIQSSVLTQ